MGDSQVGFAEATWVWVRVAALSFGGPAGQVAVMHRILVEEKRWIGEERFLHALNYCMLLPGPEAQQLATYIGWLLHGTRGGLVAGGLFVLPGFVSILALSVVYVTWKDLVLVDGLFFGLKAVVLAVVIEAVLRIGRRVLKNRAMVAVAVAAFLAIFLFAVPFPVVILGAGALGLLGYRVRPAWFDVLGARTGSSDGLLDSRLEAGAARPSPGATAVTAGTWLAVWLVPVGLLAGLLGGEHVLVELGAFFSGAATVTFGGAYAVLSYVAQQAVEHHGWLQPGEMLDGLGMAETTPGPLIQVVQFVGFLAAYREPGALHPLVAGVVGSVLTTWVTFAPCFLWIFTGAPYIEWLRGNRRVSAALSTITAAVVGVVLHLAVWFAMHVLFARVLTLRGPVGLTVLAPDPLSLDVAAALLALGSAVALLVLHLGLARTMAGAVVLGVGIRWLG